MQSASARLRSMSLDDLSRALVTSELHAFTLAELRTATTRNFTGSHFFIGEGGFGPVYKGFLDDREKHGLDPIQIAVKCLDTERPQGHREWLAEVVYLGMFSHPHLVKLVGYCCQGDHGMLIYKYLARGSLEHHLFKNLLSSLPWSTRLKITVASSFPPTGFQ